MSSILVEMYAMEVENMRVILLHRLMEEIGKHIITILHLAFKCVVVADPTGFQPMTVASTWLSTIELLIESTNLVPLLLSLHNTRR